MRDFRQAVTTDNTIITSEDFNNIAKSPLDEWIYYLNTGDILDNATAPLELLWRS